MSKWITRTLGEVTSYIAKGIPPKYVEEEAKSTIRVLNQKCNRDFRISYADSRIHDNSVKKAAEIKMVRPGDVLINSTGTGTAGRVAQIWNVPTPTTIDGHVILMRPSDEVDPLYYGYAVKAYQPTIESFAEGSTGQTEINKTRLQNEILVNFPVDKKEQYAIGRMLADLDDKIEENEKINKNLEQQAQLIFTDRFGSKDYTISQETTLGNICECILGGTPSRAKAEYWNGNISWINSGEINRFRITSPSELITQFGLDHSATKMLPTKTTVLAITGATLGQVSLLEIDACATSRLLVFFPMLSYLMNLFTHS